MYPILALFITLISTVALIVFDGDPDVGKYGLLSLLVGLFMIIHITIRPYDNSSKIPENNYTFPKSYEFDGNKINVTVEVSGWDSDGNHLVKKDKIISYRIDEKTKELLMDLVSVFTLSNRDSEIGINVYKNYEKNRKYKSTFVLFFQYDKGNSSCYIKFLVDGNIKYRFLFFDPIFSIHSINFYNKQISNYKEIKEYIVGRMNDCDPKFKTGEEM